MKITENGSARIKKTISASLKFLRKRGVLLLLVLLLTAAPIMNAAVNRQVSAAGDDTLLGTMGTILNPVKLHLAGEEMVPVKTLSEEELAEALASLDEFNEAVLKDPRLAGIFDEIIWDLVEDESFAEAIAGRQLLFADIINDERLVGVLGDVIADYLRDPKLAQDIEYFFNVIIDLISDEEMRFYIMETIAQLVEDPRLEKMFNDLIIAAVDLGYGSLVEAMVDMIAHPGVPGLMDELTEILLDSLPELVGVVEDERILGVAEELVGISLDYGVNTAVDMLADPKLRTLLADLLVVTVEAVPAQDIINDITGEALDVLEAGLSDGKLDQVINNLFNGLFVGEIDYIDVPGTGLVALPVLNLEIDSDPGATTRYSKLDGTDKNQLRARIQDWYGHNFANNNALDAAVVVQDFGADTQLWLYFHEAMNYIISQSMRQAASYTPMEAAAWTDCSQAQSQIEGVRAQIAEAIAEVPGEMMRNAIFTWLLFGVPDSKTGEDNVELQGIPAWAREFSGLISPARIEALSTSLGEATSTVIDEFMTEHEDDITAALRRALLDVPWEQMAQGLREEKKIKQAARVMLKRLVADMPMEELADEIRAEMEGAQLETVAGELIDALQLKEAGALIRSDTRVLDMLHESIPGFSMKNVANMVRSDRRIIGSLAATVANFPVETLSDFLQDEERSHYIGHGLSRILLNLVGNFVDDDRLTQFINDALINVLGSLGEGSPGAEIMRFLSAFLDNEEFAHYWVTAMPLRQGITEEAVRMYKIAVPNFFTKFMWRWNFL
jgi:hypothetical protein